VIDIYWFQQINTTLVTSPHRVLDLYYFKSGPADEDICSLPPIEPNSATCAAYIEKFTFNPQTKKCESYVYGGCAGTANLFDSHYACVAKCDRQGWFPVRKMIFR
jgi:hypothetical protein